jgi:hypothetical protein
LCTAYPQKLKARVFLFFLLIPLSVFSQYSNLRHKRIAFSSDTILLDTLSIIPNSLFITGIRNKIIPPSYYKVNYTRSSLLWIRERDSLLHDSLDVYYRVFPYFFEKSLQNRSLQDIRKGPTGFYNPFTFNSEKKNAELFKFDGLSKSGSISRGISFGNSQDVVVNSSLNLQLSGKLSDDIDVVAAITDENIPFQPEGNTQQLQDFDKVFIQFSREKDRLIVGDFETGNPPGYFMRYYKKAQGLSLATEFGLSETRNHGIMKLAASGSISKGKFVRNTLDMIEGNQGPYRLRGQNNETFLIVLSGTEKVFLDGLLLERGQQADYIIDYNTAEITFMPRRLITKDSRVIVEFEYSDRNYTRTLFTFNDEYSRNALKLRFNFYSEQDAKNQPLLQTLNDPQKALLRDVGDSLHLALSPNVDSIAYDPDQILYKRIFIDGNPVYVYSTHRDSAHFRVGFSFVGNGKGDYNPKSTSANGKVFEYAGRGRGSYLPITLLIAPRRQQLYTLGADYAFSKNTSLSTEMAVSDLNQNLFSEKDKRDDKGVALKLDFSTISDLQKKDNPWKLNTAVHYEQLDRNFRPLERFRPAEFERDWNLQNLKTEREMLSGLSFNFLRKNTGNINYQLRTLIRKNVYQGFLNSINTSLGYGKYSFTGNASQLNTSSTDFRSSYTRHAGNLSRTFGRLILGVKEEQEINRFSRHSSDTLEKNSFMFYTWQGYITNPDTSRNKFQINYIQRFDFIPKKEEFRLATLGKTFNITTELARNSNHRFTSTSTYRVLEIIDTLVGKKPETSILNRFEYNGVFLKGAVNSSTYYQLSTGQELKKDYIFQEVPRGKGAYVWNDYNGNGIKEKNEYELAVYQDTAMFIRLLIPTNEYVSTSATEFNEALYFTPVPLLRNPQAGFNKFLRKLSDQFAIQLSKKVLKNRGSELYYLDPFRQTIDDSSLITTQYVLRNIFYFNRSESKFGFDLNTQKAQSKTLLTEGFESRSLTDNTLNIRWDITRSFNYTQSLRKAVKKNRTEFFNNRNYTVNTRELEPRLNFQPGTTFRITLSYRFSNKINLDKGADAEKARSDRFGLEVKYTTIKTGSIQGRINLIKMYYNSSENTSIAYEMLEGLRIGQNLTWGLSVQRNLSNNTQLNLNYDGRKSEGSSPVHTGGVQLRAFF